MADINPSTHPATAYVSNPTGRTKRFNFVDGTAANGPKRAVARIMEIEAYIRAGGGCGCECCYGGFCGGCGHAGCGRR